MAHKRRRNRARNKSVELDITAFMNLMVVLVPFLLMTAVFTSISILDLKLPAAGTNDASANKPQKLDLNVIIRKDKMILIDQHGRVIKHIPKTQSGHNYTLLNQTLRLVKNSFPDKTTITILSEAFTPYNDIIQVMDKARQFQALVDGEITSFELFPDISIGDAPKVNSPNKARTL
jgi:biopolymer transport protein ExbD